MFFKKQYRSIENRKFIRLKQTLSLEMKLIDAQSGASYSRTIRGNTLNISREGICIETSTVTVDGVDIFNDAMSEDRILQIALTVSHDVDILIALGKVIWFDMTPRQKSFLFKAGVFLDFKHSEDRERWNTFIDTVQSEATDELWLISKIKNIFKSKPTYMTLS